MGGLKQACNLSITIDNRAVATLAV
jgi:hypothetical protein